MDQALSANHWNGNILCSIGVELTGEDPLFYDILQLSIIPLTANVEINKEKIPLNLFMKPNNPVIDNSFISTHKYAFKQIYELGIDSDSGAEFLSSWVDRLELPYTKYGTRKRIIPLCYNFPRAYSFLRAWLGTALYDEIFTGFYKDPMVVADYLNERASFHGEKVPYSKTLLPWLTNQLGLRIANQHNALEVAAVVAQVYRKLCFFGWV